MTTRVLLRGGCVLTLGASQNLAEADVLIEDDRIFEVGTGLRARDAEVVDAVDAIVMPGFVDSHRHARASLFRNLDVNGPPGEAGAAVGLDALHRPDDVYAGTLIGLLGAVEAGVTTVVDWSGEGAGADTVEAALQAHADAGVRTTYVATGPAGHEDGESFRRLADAAPPLTTIATGVDPGADPPDDRAWTFARELGKRIYAHAGPRARPGSIAALGGQRLLGGDVTLVHPPALSAEDVEAIASSGASVALAPSSEMTEGYGSPPIQELVDRDIRPGLGVGDERAAPGDLFAQMRATISLQHATVFDRKLSGKAGVPKLMSTRDVIRFATIDGARAAGLDATAGSLEPGMQADVVVLRTDRPNVFPINDPIGAVVWGMDTSNVDWVFVAGRPLMRAGVLQAEVARARALATAARERVASAAGLVAPAAVGGRG